MGRDKKRSSGRLGTTSSVGITYYLKIPLCNNVPATGITHNLKRKKVAVRIQKNGLPIRFIITESVLLLSLK